jgi:hypothetical protein
VSTQPGYLAPAVSVASSLPRRGAKSAVLIVPVVSSGPEDVNDEPGAAVAAANALPEEAVSEIEDGLRALSATGAAEQVHRLVVKSLPVASVLTVGLGKQRDEFPADLIRRAAGTAARSLGGAEAVITTLGALPGTGVLEAAVEGLVLGSYRFTVFRSDKTAPKDPGLRTITVLSTDKAARAQAAHATAVATAVATATAVAVAAGVGLLLLATGLRRRRRRAWQIAVLTTAVITLLGIFFHQIFFHGPAASITALALLTALILKRREYGALPDPSMDKWRATVAKVVRAGYVAKVRRAKDIPDGEHTELAKLAARRGTETERGFSMALSRLADSADPECVLVTAEQDGRVRGMLHSCPGAPTACPST